MLAKVYAFEREAAHCAAHESVATTALRAVVAASRGIAGIRYEELTGSDDPRTLFALLFADSRRMQQFDDAIAAALQLSGVCVGIAQAPELGAAPGAALPQGAG